MHCAPEVVAASALVEDGWIPVNPATFATKFPNVYAVGDVTSAPVPRAGGIAEGEAATVAKVLIAKLTEDREPLPYDGVAGCYVELGNDPWVGSMSTSRRTTPGRGSPPRVPSCLKRRKRKVAKPSVVRPNSPERLGGSVSWVLIGATVEALVVPGTPVRLGSPRLGLIRSRCARRGPGLKS